MADHPETPKPESEESKRTPEPTPAETKPPNPELPQAPNATDVFNATRNSELVKFWTPKPDQQEAQKAAADVHPSEPTVDEGFIRIASDEDVARMQGMAETFARHQRDRQRLAKLDSDLPEWVDKPDTIHLSLEDEGVAEFSFGPPENEDEPPYDNPPPQHPITPQVRKRIEDQGKWGDDWPPRGKNADSAAEIVYRTDEQKESQPRNAAHSSSTNLSPEDVRFLESDLAKEVAASPEFRKIVEGQQIAGGVFKHRGSADGGAKVPDKESIDEKSGNVQSENPHKFETAIGDARLWGIVTMIALAIAFSRRSANSDLAVWVLLWIATVLAILIVNTHRAVRASQFRVIITVGSIAFAVPLVLLAGYWLTAPALSAETAYRPGTLVSSPTPFALASSSSLPTPTPSVTPPAHNRTKWLNGIVFKGGLPQRLDFLMKARGYVGPTDMEVLYVVSDDQNTTEIYISTDAHPTPENSQLLYASDGFNFQRGEDISNVYVFAKKDGKINIEFKPR